MSNNYRTTLTENTALQGLEAFNKFLSIAYQQGENCHFKIGHNQLYQGQVENGPAAFIAPTFKLDGKRYPEKGQQLEAFSYLRAKSESDPRIDGVFWIPGKALTKAQHQGSNFISSELDWGDAATQERVIIDFCEKSGLQLSMAISSGSKSIHAHFKADRLLTPTERFYLQMLLALSLLGDPAVVNPHQPMRAPGFYRRTKGGEQLLLAWSDRQYSYEELINGFTRFFNYRGWKLPKAQELFDNQSKDRKVNPLWAELRRYLAGHATQKFDYSALSESQKIKAIGKILNNDLSIPTANNELDKAIANSLNIITNAPEKNRQQFVDAKERRINYETAKENRKAVNFWDWWEFDAIPQINPEAVLTIIADPRHNFHKDGNLIVGAPVWRTSSSGSSLHFDTERLTFRDWQLQETVGLIRYCYWRWNQDKVNFGDRCTGGDAIKTAKRIAVALEIPTPHNLAPTPKKIIELLTISTKDFLEKLNRNLSLISKATLHYLKQFKQLPERVGLNGKGRKVWQNIHKQSALVPLTYSPQATEENLKSYFENERKRLISYVPGKLDLSDRVDDMEIIINKNQITEVVEEFFRQCEPGDVALLDAPAGIGKTHQIGQINPNNIGETTRVWYLDSQYRNPNTSTIETAVTEVPVKHGGITIDPYRTTELGNQYRRRTLPNEPLEPWDYQPNCKYSETFDATREKGFYLRGGNSSPNCENCSAFKNLEGKISCSALLERLIIIDNNKERFLSSHPNSPSISASTNISYLVYEEADKNLDPFTRVSINPADVVTTNQDLRVKGGEQLADILQPLTNVIYHLISDLENAPLYGFSAKDVLDLINIDELILNFQNLLNTKSPDVLNIVAKLLDKLLMPDLFNLCHNFSDPKKRAEAIRKQVRYNWLSSVLRILANEGNGSFRVDKLGLHLTLFNWRIYHQVKAAAGTLAASATLNKTELARKLKIPANKIVTIKIKSEDLPAYSNLTFKYIKGAGFGKQRRHESEYTAGQRAIAFANWLISIHHNPGILDHKIHLQNYEGFKGLHLGYYGHDSRGSNKFQYCDALALIGEFWPNLSAKLTEFETLMGEIMEKDDQRFTAWLRNEMVAEILGQAVGRLRSHRRGGESLVCYLIGDSYNVEEITRYYPGAKVEVLDMAQVCLEASPKKEQKVAQLAEIISLAVAKGDKPGRNAVAKQLQWSFAQVSKLASYLGQKIGISCGWDELIRVVTNVWNYINTFVTSSGVYPNELERLVLELFFPGLYQSIIAPETAVELIYLAYREYGFDFGKILAFFWERSLQNAINCGLVNNANKPDLLNHAHEKA